MSVGRIDTSNVMVSVPSSKPEPVDPKVQQLANTDRKFSAKTTRGDQSEPASRASDSSEASRRGDAKLSDEERETLGKVVDGLQRVVDALDRKLEFSIHEGTHRILVRVIDKEDNRVIREIPPEKILDLVAKINELLGLFVDERA